MHRLSRLGLILVRCDCCNRRQFCAVDGVALCESCCPGAVQAAREEALAAREEALAAREEALAAREGAQEVELLPGEYTGPPVPFAQVAHLF